MTEIITNQQKQARDAVRTKEINLIRKQLVLLLEMEEVSDIIDQIELAKKPYTDSTDYLVLDRLGLREESKGSRDYVGQDRRFTKEESFKTTIEEFQLTVDQVVDFQKKLCGV